MVKGLLEGGEPCCEDFPLVNLRGLISQEACDFNNSSGKGRSSSSKALMLGFGLSLGLRWSRKVKSLSFISVFLKYGLEYLVFMTSESKMVEPFLIFLSKCSLSRSLWCNR